MVGPLKGNKVTKVFLIALFMISVVACTPQSIASTATFTPTKTNTPAIVPTSTSTPKPPYQHETAMVDPHPGMSIYGWSKDSSYLLFYYYFSPDGGDSAFWWDGFDLQRINVQTGEIEQVIPGYKESFVAFDFSPDETQIAYTRAQDNPSIFYIRNLVTLVEKTA